MANTFAPFGFQHVGRLDGAAPNSGQSWYKILSSNSTPIYFGDPVTNSSGYLVQSTAGTTQIRGVLIECKYLATSPAMTLYTRWWSGSNAQVNPDASVIDDPYAKFLVQGNAQILQSHVGKNANFALGTGNSTTGVSGASLDVSTIATTATLPFRIVGLYTASPGSNGSDTTTPYNWAYVTFNNQDYRSTTGL